MSESIPYVDDVSNTWQLHFEVTAKVNLASRDEFADFTLKAVSLAGRTFQPRELSATFCECCESRIEDHLFDLRVNPDFVESDCV